MKKLIPLLVLIFFLGACDGFDISPQPVATWIIPPSRTPSIVTATPIILTLPFTQTANPGVTVIAPITLTNTEIPTPTSSNTPPPTETPTPIPTATAIQSVAVDILGCNTGLDITHGMGEVTNAFVTLKNVGNVELTSLIATLYALDEGREHPDKIQEIVSIPVGYEVTLKLTVDSTYKAESAIQVEVNSDQGLFPREGVASCRDLGRLTPQPDGLNTPVPLTP